MSTTPHSPVSDFSDRTPGLKFFMFYSDFVDQYGLSFFDSFRNPQSSCSGLLGSTSPRTSFCLLKFVVIVIDIT